LPPGDISIRFAGYELDPIARVLKLHGQPVPLSPKTFDLLLFFADHPGQLVTKEELLTALWPDSYVEERNLSQHVFLLRKAIADGAQGDQIVVTIPGKGYQFAATVERLPRADMVQGRGELLLHAVQSVTRVVVEQETDDTPATLQLPPPRRLSRAFWASVAAAALMLAAVGSYLTWRWMRPAPAGHIDLVLSDAENLTGDAEFDPILNRALTIDLEQSPFLNLLPRSKIQETLAEMQRKKDEPLTAALALEICERNSAQAVLHGSVAKIGNTYLVILDATSCVDGKQIAGYKGEASSKDGVLTSLDAAAAHVRRQLGESAASLQRFQTPIAQATTSSLDALRFYSLGMKSEELGDMKGAQALAQRAIEIDQSFASAYRVLGVATYDRGDLAQATIHLTKAFQLRQHTTERERLLIEIAYYAIGIYDYDATIGSMNLFNQIYPNSAGNWGNLCNMYTQIGDYRSAIEAGERAYRLDPRMGFTAQVLGRAYKRANRFADAKRVSEAAIAAGAGWAVHGILFQVAFAQRDAARLKAETDAETAGSAPGGLDDLGFADATSGKLREAKEDFSRSRIAALRDGNPAFAAGVWLDVARVQIELEQPTQAAGALKQLNEDSHKGEVDQAELAILQAGTGEVAAAQRFLAATQADTGKRDTVILYCQLPQLRAELALKAHQPAEALRALEPARPYQMRDFDVPYLRAQAETESGMLDAAADDYRLILANQGIDPISPEYSLAYLRLARVLATQKKIGDARKEYQSFFDAWKDADADLPLLKDAKREFAKLPQ
jgi:DNA-binding winged helix-turn-helix (wHTH) protein/tetratricopeptide (TPR) repeat protein